MLEKLCLLALFILSCSNNSLFGETTADSIGVNRTKIVNRASQVELDIFSGKPDPQWSISSTDTNLLLAQIHRLKPVSSDLFPEYLGHLGYRGLTIKLNSSGDLIKIWRGFVRYDRQGKSSCFQDPHRQLEKSVLQTGKLSLPVSLYAKVMRSIE